MSTGSTRSWVIRPWEIAKPSSKEFFSNIDPLYRSYGKQEAVGKQTEYFADEEIELDWLEYNADYRAQSNYVSYASNPFGDANKHDKSQDRFSIVRGKQNYVLHDRWASARRRSRGYADPHHPFWHQGSADLNLYKLFLEQGHNLLRDGGRLGFIVPSGLYSDYGTGPLRELFVEACRWEWLFGFENREGIFDIHRSYKFNPIVIEKGGQTDAIQTAFMRRRLEDWERAESIATPYTREQVEQFSPKSKAILEIQSDRDLEILDKIYANSVLLGDDGPDGWGIKYATEFHMTNDSKLFPPRPKWEAKGYRPDEYSRWLKGNWRPIEELWPELGVNPNEVVPIDAECQAEIEARTDEVQRTDWRLRCAQPPYDSIPIPRADIPAGIILSREADAWIHEDEIDDTALPLYEGRMIGQFDFSEKGWVSGKGRGAVWHDIPWSKKRIEPQYCMAANDYECATDRYGNPKALRGMKTAFMDVTSSTNVRTMIASVVGDFPAGNSAPVLDSEDPWILSGFLNTFAYDFVARRRCAGLHLNWFVIEETPLPRGDASNNALADLARFLTAVSPRFGDHWLVELASQDDTVSLRERWAITRGERLRVALMIDAVAFALSGLDWSDAIHILSSCDMSKDKLESKALNPKGFWRVDKEKHPELRQTTLTLIAFDELQQRIEKAGGNSAAGIGAFLQQNDAEGWILPEDVRLADFGIAYNDRALSHQPVASILGPRFCDWQLGQSADESWRECRLHVRNTMGEKGYRKLLDDMETNGEGGRQGRRVDAVSETRTQYRLFD